MAEKGTAILLLLALFIGGAIIGFNLIETIGFDLGISFSDIHGFKTFMFISLARLVGFALMILCVWVIVNIIRS